MRLANPLLLPIAAFAALVRAAAPVSAQSPSVVAHTVDVSRQRAVLELQLSDDEVVRVGLGSGEININGTPAGTYQRGGKLESAWRAFLDSAASQNTADLVRSGKQWPLAGFTGNEATGMEAIGRALNGLTAVPATAVPQLLAPPAPFGEADERETGVAQQVIRSGPAFAGVGPTVAGLFGAFVALASIAFGLVSFAPRQLGVVSDTVQHSFFRSFFAGLFAQPLILPALGVLCVALVLTVVGILVVPVAIAAFTVACAAAVVGGYIAAARALGESYHRRRMARGIIVGSDPAYRSILIGLAGLLMIWAPFALLGWVPGFGTALLWVAIVFTWVMATAGLGATILSRAGLRGRFGRQVAPQLSGELSWSTVDEIAPSKSGERSTP